MLLPFRIGARALAVWMLSALACPAAVPVGVFFNNVFPADAPGSGSGWAMVNAFPNLTFVDPIWLTQVPASNDLIVVSKVGKIWRFPNSAAVTPAQRTLVLDLEPQVQASEDQGMYRICFHPQFGNPGSSHRNDVFITYNHRPADPAAAPDRSMWRLSRFQWLPVSGTIDAASEQVLIQQYDPHRWHNGGAMDFDNDGFLLVTCGDGGGANDEFGQTQKINGGYFGGVLRIDVDNDPARSHAIRRQPLEPAGKPAAFPASFSQGYGIPNDNPWQDAGGGRLEEFYAIGLRSPHSAKYDAVAGELWVGDVGQASAEEVNRIFKGGNYQWPYREGNSNGPKGRPSAANLIGAEMPPAHTYGVPGGACVIGGFRYRGAKWSVELGGKLIFGDNRQGSISAATVKPDQSLVLGTLLTGFGAGVYTGLSAITTDDAGEIYMLKLSGVGLDGGIVRRLERNGTRPEPPALLSATGLFTNMATLQAAEPLVPYEVASPLWSDGAAKKRWLCIPNNGVHDTAAEKISFSEEGNWTFPPGTVLVKHFETNTDANNPAAIKRLETRVIVCTADGDKYGVTYKWNAAGTDATLLTDGEEMAYDYARADGSVETREWSIPSRADCFQCHSEATGQALGLRSHQINRLVNNPANGQPENQLSRFATAGYFTPTPSAATIALLPRARALDDETAPLELRVRSYLDANCSHCHRPGASAPFFDARLATPLRGQNLVDAVITGQFHMDPAARYIKPGNPTLSAVHVRAGSSAPGIAMPPLAKHRVDEQAVNVLGEYISGLPADQFTGQATPTARYFRLATTGNGLASIAELVVLDGRGMPIPSPQISVAGVSSLNENNPGNLARDGNPATYWLSGSGTAPQYLSLDLGVVREIGGFIYTPRQDVNQGRITNFQIQLSQNGSDWSVAGSGTWVANSTATQRFDHFNRPRPVRCEIAGPVTPVSAAFEVTITFDTVVTDFTLADIQVSRGAVTALRGRGYHYVATVLAHEDTVEIRVPEDVVAVGQLGSRSSNVLEVENVGETSAVASFSHLPELVSGPFSVGLSFDKPVGQLDRDDIAVDGGTREEVFMSSPQEYLLLIRPDGSGDVAVSFSGADTRGNNGLPVIGGIQKTFVLGVPQLAVEAEAGAVAAGFVTVQDPAASGGAWLWVPEGTREGDGSYDPALKTSFQVTVPHSGEYRLMGVTRSDDAESDSFYVGVDGDAAPARWLANQASGETGSGLFHANLVNADGNPRIFNLAAGTHLLDLYAGEDGARIDCLEVTPVRPTATWVGNGKRAELPYRLTLRFSTEVSGLEIGDFFTAGGSIASLSGSGREYHLVLQYTTDEIVVALKEGAVQDVEGRTNPGSPTIIANWVPSYEQWTIDNGLDASLEAQRADADGDGVAQILEYAFGLNPSLADRRTFDPNNPQLKGLPKITVHVGNNGFYSISINYPVRRYEALEYVPLYTSDFSTFDEGGVHIERYLDWEWAWVRAYDPAASSSNNPKQRFGTVQVEPVEAEE